MVQMDEKLKDIERSAEEIVQSFVEATEDLPETKETYYSQDAYNIVRPDDEPTPKKDLEEFRKRFVTNMPMSDDDGNLKVEVAKWVER